MQELGCPRCSVIIATLSRLQFFRQALKSALDQTVRDIEIVVVKNGPDDGTVDFVRSLDDPRINLLVYPEPLGATGACNAGLKVARGEWRGFLHDDDIWAPTKLEEQLRELACTGRDWSYTGCVYIDKAGKVVAGMPAPTPDQVVALSQRRYVVPGGMSTMIWRTGCLDEEGLLDPQLTYTVDWDLSLRLLAHGPPAGVCKPLVAYRQHSDNLSLTAIDRIQTEQGLMVRKHGVANGPIEASQPYRVAASEFMRAGMRKAAAAAFLKAVSLGNRTALKRMPALLLPKTLYPRLRRSFLSDAAWVRDAEAWLAESSATRTARTGEAPGSLP